MGAEDAADLTHMATKMASDPDNLEHTLHEILTQARFAIAADGAGVMIRHRRRVEVAAASDDEVRAVDELQISAGEGPCRSAALGGPSYVIIADMAADERWPAWARPVARLGWHSALSLQLATHNELLGALNLYCRRDGAFDEDDADTAALFARHASIALAAALEVRSLRQAIGARHTIGLAQGILMERYDIDADRAFTVLRRHSQQHNVKLRAVAEQVIEHRRLPG